MLPLNKVKCLVIFLIFQLFAFPALSQSPESVYRDSIAMLLEKRQLSSDELHLLNNYITECWKTEPGSEEVIAYAHKVLDLTKNQNDKIIFADALINLVRLYLLKYESTKSLEYALEAYKIYEKEGDHEKMGYTLLQLGIVYYTQNNYLKSLEYYNNAVNEFEKVNNNSYIATLYYLSGINYSKLKNYASAHVFFNRALKIKTELNDQQGLAECLIGKAEAFLGQSKPDSALASLTKAEGLVESKNKVYGEAKISILTADALYQKKDFKKAEEMALSGLVLADSIGTRELITDGFRVLHKIYASLENYNRAYYFLENYLNVRDSIVNESTARSFSQLEAGYLIEKKQNEILLLENINKNRTILLRASIIIGILALLLAIVFYNKQQVKQKANQELKAAYSELEHTQKQLLHQEKLASLGQLTAGIAHEIKNPLNFVNNFSQVSVEMIKEYTASNNEQDRKEILKDLEVNIEKIASHGARANSIVDRMLDHSRTGEQSFQETDILKLCEEYYNLAFQATRINNPGFNCKFNLITTGSIPKINVASQEISRVLLNIFNNCLYAVSDKHKSDMDFKPEINVNAQIDSAFLTLTISDNGPGIPEEIIEKIFQPFFTTKPPGEGTGLGLSLSYDIIRSHNGTFSASNLKSGGASFTITLPLNI